ncbi:hypothetical protein BC938DRAFT_480168 [Jimgerdemannia flammicorona]|uniref:Inositol hexakisphosphate and diphosphoinositol-pentakisphosphate kinase n=1 Tax=Jimgerdemannia flammicorona TaxID=994334 RepID=A0A433QJA0_9FUNG|nr:hypothetical protein BC938DRAFT_480168 [Jimgerdemannia flammicorona]
MPPTLAHRLPSPPPISHQVVVGVCAMDNKARSKPMRNILNRMLSLGEFEFETVVFGDKVILDEAVLPFPGSAWRYFPISCCFQYSLIPHFALIHSHSPPPPDVENWPGCDFFISFFSSGFPLSKATRYVSLRRPYAVNDLAMQECLWDRRVVLTMLDAIGVRTPQRLTVNRDGGPRLPEEVRHKIELKLGIDINAPVPEEPFEVLDVDTIRIGDKVIKKPFVEKPVSGENHNIHIYYDSARGGGGRKLFRKEFMEVDDAEDVKVYTIGPNFTHAETRKSPVVDGHVRRNTDGKEVRYITELTPVEKEMARKVCLAFGQTICGFDLLRVAGTSYVIDVNGWSFVKGNDHYYDNAARILREMFLTAGHQRKFSVSGSLPPELQFENSWRLKAFVSVFRHADRTPKQKMKFSFSSDPFVELLEGAHEEVIMRQEHQLRLVSAATAKAIAMGSEDATKLMQLKEVLDRKSELPGTKVQLKPSFDKPDGQFQKLQLIVKWGGEVSAEVLWGGVCGLSGSVHACGAVPITRPGREPTQGHDHHEQECTGRHQDLHELRASRHRHGYVRTLVFDFVGVVIRTEVSFLPPADIFAHSFMGTQELPPNCLITSKELLDDSNAAKEQMDAVKLRLRQLLRSDQRGSLDGAPWHEDLGEPSEMVCEVIALMHRTRETMRQNLSRAEDIDALQARWCCSESPMLFRERWEKLFKDFCDVDRDEFDPSKVSELYDSIKYDALHNRAFVEGVFADPAVPQGAEGSLDRVKELYRKARSMFDFVAPQEYGISPEEKMEIGLLTSLPLLKKIVGDLEGARTAENPCTRLYFTKESHVHTLLNVVFLSGLPTRIPRIAIPELDYLTQITFELYERNRTIGGDKEYSLRVGFSPGAHDPNIIDLQMDAKHCLSVAPRRNLTDHLPLDQALSYYQRHLNDPGVENIERQIIEKRYHYAEEDEDDEVAERVVMQLGEIAGEDVMMEIESEGRNEVREMKPEVEKRESKRRKPSLDVDFD